MKMYVLSMYQPDGPIPSKEVLDGIMAEVGAINADLRAQGKWVFGNGLLPPAGAAVVRAHAGKVSTTDGPFTEAKEHIGGFTIIKAKDRDEALQWAERLVRATTLPIEVRQFYGEVD